ncbi:uncharacterized protein LOC115445179 [Manduca sexta]|uniref:Uncharacterized protein n=1 Tax=Manduca sexta TaxID=7130 RepID=A0A922CNE3_MANSE|nr:uncharacterized protein LOC115445179 [Manduca sexta]KAG6452692.1 hypothetical protein O3G_MSEX007764 [Manduca sexta]
MILNTSISYTNFLKPIGRRCGVYVLTNHKYSKNLEQKYSEEQREKLLEIINSENDVLSRYDIAKTRLKKISQWKSNNGLLQSLADVEMMEGFSERITKKMFDSILAGPIQEEHRLSNKIKGQILYPNLSNKVVKDCKTVLTVYITVNSVCWTLIDKDNYEIKEWKYYGIDYPEGKKFQITDILNIAWRITHQLPTADIYVMKAEATTLRASGSDPNNPKVLAVNLQKAQMVAMIVALINARSNLEGEGEDSSSNEKCLEHKVYFLRPTLPYRLYGTLVGNERVSTDQTVEMLLREDNGGSKNKRAYVPEKLKEMFRMQKDLQKDMLGHCFLLSITFMDLCIYKDQERINKLLKHGP